MTQTWDQKSYTVKYFESEKMSARNGSTIRMIAGEIGTNAMEIKIL